MNIDKDFPMLNKDIIYFDNSATTLKPKCVIDAMNDYYENYSANAHRGDYNISFKVDDEIDKSREAVKKFINARRKEEIIFTSGATESLNMIVFGFFENILKENDEVILSKSEHASNILPWYILSLKKKIKLKFIPLDEDNKITTSNLLKTITDKTKVISLAHITNVIGDTRNINEIIEIAHSNNIYTVVDASQSIPHVKTNIKEMDPDFLVFSGHKMCGPTGIGVLYGKYELLLRMMPFKFGGGMNESFSEEKLILENIPTRFEAGTQNIAAIIGLRHAIEYIDSIGLNEIHKHEMYLKNYLIRRLKEIPYIKIYNENSESSIVLINADDIMSGDLGLYLNSKNICVRSGTHCAKMLKEESHFNDTVRISLYFYNTYEEIDKLIDALKNKNELYNFLK
jgi:cysteine desulfurase/selenocysteine lyase